MEENKPTLKYGLIYLMIAVIIVVALILTVVFLATAENPFGSESTTEPKTTDTQQTVTTTDSTKETTVQTTTYMTTYPPATVPGATSRPNTDRPAVEFPALTEAKKSYLLSLDNTLRGWGPGVSVDESNRPHGALSAQKSYGQYGASYIMNDDKIYLTFDEGYENGYTAQILDTLKEKNVKAVFFITMPYAKSEPALVQRMIDEGHIVGNHSTAHLSFPSMTLEEAYEDIKGLHEYVYEHFDYTMTLFRFPMGESSDRMAALLKELGYTSVFWSFAYRDWETDNQPAHDEAFDRIVSRAHPGAIYLLHAVSKTNTEVLGDVIDAFRAKGYEIAQYPIN